MIKMCETKRRTRYIGISLAWLMASCPALTGSAAEANAVPEAIDRIELISSEVTSRGYVGLGAHTYEPDESRGLPDSDNGGMSAYIGHYLGKTGAVEFILSSTLLDTGIAGTTDFYHYSLGVNFLWLPWLEKKFSPFFLIGAGIAENDVLPDANDDISWYADAGIGLLFPEMGKSRIRLRIEIRSIYEDYLDGQKDTMAMLSLFFPIGVTEKRVERQIVLRSPPPVSIKDSDNDGVPDELDRCPQTLPQAKTDNVGCAIPNQRVVLKGVTFVHNSSRLLPDAKTILQTVAESLMGQRDMRVLIAGHTDSTGSSEYNLKLSQARAESVREFLIEHGVGIERMEVMGYGETRPLVDESTLEGRDINRRVEIRILSR